MRYRGLRSKRLGTGDRKTAEQLCMTIPWNAFSDLSSFIVFDSAALEVLLFELDRENIRNQE